jgi:hypothetical protein
VPVFARYTLAFDLKLRKKHGKTSVTPNTEKFVTIQVSAPKQHKI